MNGFGYREIFCGRIRASAGRGAASTQGKHGLKPQIIEPTQGNHNMTRDRVRMRF